MSANSLFRLVYWTTWFVVVPAVLAGLAVWLLSPADASASVGAISYLQSWVRDQPVPVAIVFFTGFEVLLWSQRHVLPLASRVPVGGRFDVPVALRKRFEGASSLLEEASRIRNRHDQEIERALPSGERDILTGALDSLRVTMEAPAFDSLRFQDALHRAEAAVETYLSRWRKGELREYGESIGIAVAVALLLRAFVVEAFKIPSRSMVPTLAVGDHIFVNKFAYGPMIPWTRSRLFSRMPPTRGDVMVFQFPEHPDQDFIKRVVATPGDKLEAVDGRPMINGWLAPRCKVGPFSYQEGDGPFSHHAGELFVEYMGGAAYLTFFDRTMQSPGDRQTCHTNADCPGGHGCVESTCGEYQGPYIVKPGEVWVMGDNRNNSHDSRGWFDGRGGGVPFDNIRGRALWVWMSFTQTGSIAWDRIGVSVMGTPRLPEPFNHNLRSKLLDCMNNRPPLEATTPPLLR